MAEKANINLVTEMVSISSELQMLNNKARQFTEDLHVNSEGLGALREIATLMVEKASQLVDQSNRYTPEEVDAWNRSVEDCGTQQSYDKYRKKLSEEIVDNKDVKYIYESPDGGKTIYRRKFGEYGKRELVKDWNKEKENIING